MDRISVPVTELASYRTIELTTTGRRSGQPSRIEIWWFHIGDRFIITGTPGPRDWYANVLADPGIVIHTPLGDHAATAVPVTDPGERRAVMTHPDTQWYQSQHDRDHLIASSPMIEAILRP